MSVVPAEHYRAEYTALAGQFRGHSVGWLKQAREQAISHFVEVGFPTPRDEDWKYTNVQPIAKRAFKPVTESCLGLVPEDLDLFVCQNMSCHLLVFVNGRYAPQLSQPGQLDAGIVVGSLAAAIENNPAELEGSLAHYASATASGFAALNTAFMDDGVYIRLPDNAVISDPVHVIYLSTQQDDAVSQPRNLIIAGVNSKMVIVESYVCIGEGTYFTNVMTEIVLESGAQLEHYKLQEESKKAYHISTLQVYQKRNSRFISHSVSVGGRLVRNDINVVLDEEGAECELNGLYLADGRQHVDNHTRIDHAKPHCTSRELYKGVINGHGRAVFNGRVYVHPGAQKTNAEQSNSNLLLSPDAEIDTKPQLEIYADDVKCSHGATVGQLDPEMLFYLRSRGIGELTAKGLLTYGFAHDVVERMNIAPLRVRVEDILVSQLPHGEHLKTMV